VIGGQNGTGLLHAQLSQHGNYIEGLTRDRGPTYNIYMPSQARLFSLLQQKLFNRRHMSSSVGDNMSYWARCTSSYCPCNATSDNSSLGGAATGIPLATSAGCHNSYFARNSAVQQDRTSTRYNGSYMASCS